MKKIVVAIPHSHAWMWVQSCLASLVKNPPKADGFEVNIVVVDNSPWSPAIKGVIETSITDPIGRRASIVPNYKGNKFHASALDCVVEKFDFDYLMAFETDVLALSPDWLQWFVDQMRPTDFAVGHWHHEKFINPSCTLYRGDVVRRMRDWCKANTEPISRWGENFSLSGPLDTNMPNWAEEEKRTMVDWVAGPFAEKRGFPEGTTMKESPSGQLKGIAWYEPGQMLHHWAVNEGYTYTVCPTATTFLQPGLPVQTFYGRSDEPGRQLEISEMQNYAKTVHLWGGTRALDIVKHEVTCEFVKKFTPFWLEREARFWKDSVPADVQEQTLALIRKYGWHYKGAGTPDVTERDREAVRMIQSHYANGGVKI